MDYEKEIQQLTAKIVAYEQIIHDLSAPIIPSIVEDTILVPIAGHISKERLTSIRSRVLEYLADHREINITVFDLTGIEIKDIIQLDINSFAIKINQLHSALKLMGIRPIYVGFNPQLVREIVQAGIQIEIETYVNFKTALAVLLNSNDKSLHLI